MKPATKPSNRAWGFVKFDSYSFEVMEGGDEQELEEIFYILQNGGISTPLSRGRISTLRITHGTYLTRGTAVVQWVRCSATNRKVAGVIRFFIDIKPFRSHYGHGVDSVCNRNEYQEHFLGVKAAGA